MHSERPFWTRGGWTGAAIPPPRDRVRVRTRFWTRLVGAAPATNWFEWLAPTTNQRGESCVGQAWANWMECMLRRYVGKAALAPGEQLDGWAIWKKGREMFWNGSLDGGLYLAQGFAAAVELGILPCAARLARVSPHAADLAAALADTPLVQGHLVHEGWYRPLPLNGCLDHAPAPTDAAGGHATLLAGVLRQRGGLYWPFLNSWGADWGWNGLGLMSTEEWQEGWIGDGPVTAILPRGWETHRGWREHIVRGA